MKEYQNETAQDDFFCCLANQESGIAEEESEEDLLNRRAHYVSLLLSAKPMKETFKDELAKIGMMKDFAEEIFDQAEMLVFEEISAKRESAFLKECKLMIAERGEGYENKRTT